MLKEKGYSDHLFDDLRSLAKIDNENIYLKLNLELVVPDNFSFTDAEMKQNSYYKEFQDINFEALYGLPLVNLLYIA